MIIDTTDLILLINIEHELTSLLSAHYIHNQYGKLNYLESLRKDLNTLIKSESQNV
jgi:hypothetical protein